MKDESTVDQLSTQHSALSTSLVPIIDTHQHLWDLDRFRLPWLDGEARLAHSFLLSDYLREANGLNVVGTVYMEVDVEPAQQAAEAEYVVALCRQEESPMRGAIISGRPSSEAFEPYIRPFTRKPYAPYIRGVRQVLHGGSPAGYCLAPEFIRGIRLLGECGLTYDICIRPEELLDAAALIDACPDTQFILDHCGNANVQSPDLSQWRRDIAAVAERPNVACKISGIVASAVPGRWTADNLAPIVHHCAEVFGSDRLVFGGDWPVCTLAATLRQWVTALRQIVAAWSEERQRKLFHDNALRVYGLSG